MSAKISEMKPKTKAKFEDGSIVSLLTGGMVMTVESTENGYVTTVWHDDVGNSCREIYRECTLKPDVVDEKEVVFVKD